MSRIAVTGATGALGSCAARQLLARLEAQAADGAGADGPGADRADAGAPTDEAVVRLVVRDPSRLAADLRERVEDADGDSRGVPVEVAAADFGDADACRRAFADVDTLLLVSAGESGDRAREHRTAVAAAADAQVRHIVYTSFTGASADATFTLARDHGDTEAAIREAADRTGMTWTFLRDDFYLDVLIPWAGEDRTLRGPAGEGRCAFVARDDVADAAAVILADPAPWAGQVLEMTGPEALTLDEVAQRLSTVTGQEFRFIDETMDEARASRAVYDVPDWQIEAWISTYTAIASGALAPVRDDVHRVLGREPRTLEDVATGR